MKLIVSVPSKTFLLGEYLALEEGRALVLNSKPRFETEFKLRGSGIVQGIHPESPAGKILSQEKDIFNDVDVRFDDPHLGLGGFGASSAQFISVFVAARVIRDQKIGFDPQKNVLSVWRNYIDRTRSDMGRGPSGADVIAQVVGGLSEVSMNPFSATSTNWPFANLGFLLLATGRKTKTHEHLKNLGRIEVKSLSAYFDLALSALTRREEDQFVMAINGYRNSLVSLGFLESSAQAECNELLLIEGVKAVKGCGAMGGDVLFVLFDKQYADNLLKHLNSKKFRLVATHEDISSGTKVEFLPSPELTQRLL